MSIAEAQGVDDAPQQGANEEKHAAGASMPDLHGMPGTMDPTPIRETAMSRTHALILALALPVLAVPAARAQYVGPSDVAAADSVAAILADPVDDRDVTLTGVILRKLGDEMYIFSDGTGEIRVEIDDEDFPASPIDESTRITLRGEIDKTLMADPEVDVDVIELVR